MTYDRVTRWLHAFILLSIAVQLISSGLMEIPRPGRMIPASEVAFFKIHRWSGITVFGFLLLHWLWGITGHVAGRWVHLFPWFSKEGLGKVISDLKSVPLLIREGFSGKADQDQGTAIAGAVHGLGLLAATGMALTGSVLFFGIRPDGAMNGYVHMVKEFHEFIAGFLWAFLAGHVSMAILHQWQGDRVISRMFNLLRG
jgi:cytochrome b561